MKTPAKLFMVSGRRSAFVDVDLEKIDLTRPIAQRSLAQVVARTKHELEMPRGLTRGKK